MEVNLFCQLLMSVGWFLLGIGVGTVWKDARRASSS